MGRDTKRKLYLKKHVFVIEKYVEDVKQEEQKHPRSAGIDNEVHLSCKSRGTGKFVQK